MTSVTIWVPGVPATQGSTKAYIAGGRARVTHANKKTIPWRNQVAVIAHQELGPRHAPAGVSVACGLGFVLPRPAGHWRQDGTPRKGAAEYPRLDIDKLARQSDWTGVNTILRGLTDEELERVHADAAILAKAAQTEAWYREVAQ